jgi:hypothetical protein
MIMLGRNVPPFAYQQFSGHSKVNPNPQFPVAPKQHLFSARFRPNQLSPHQSLKKRKIIPPEDPLFGMQVHPHHFALQPYIPTTPVVIDLRKFWHASA